MKYAHYIDRFEAWLVEKPIRGIIAATVLNVVVWGIIILTYP